MNSIAKTFWIRNISEDLTLLEMFDEPELHQQKNLKVTPLMIINCIYNMNRGRTDYQANTVKRFALLKGVQARLRYQRFKFESYLKVNSQF